MAESELRDFIHETAGLREFAEFLPIPVLELFISYRKGSVEEAKDAVKAFVMIRTKHYASRLLGHLNPKKNPFFQSQHVKFLKHRDKDGAHVLVNTLDWDADVVTLESLFPTYMMYIDELLCRLSTDPWNNRIIVIFEAGGVKMKQFKFLTVDSVRTNLNFVMNCPIRIKAIHIPNCGRTVALAIGGLKFLVKGKMRKRIIVDASGFGALHEALDPSILPTTLGGALKPEEAYDTQVYSNIEDKEDLYRRFCDTVKRHVSSVQAY